MKSVIIQIKFKRFVFSGTDAEVDAYADHLVAETKRYAARNDFESVLAIDKDLRTIEAYWRNAASVATRITLRHQPLTGSTTLSPVFSH